MTSSIATFTQIDLLIGLNGTFSTNRLYRAFDKYVAVTKVKLMRKFDNVTCWEYIP